MLLESYTLFHYFYGTVITLFNTFIRSKITLLHTPAVIFSLSPGSKQYSAVCEVHRYRGSGQKTALTDACEFPIADGEDYVMLVICVPVRVNSYRLLVRRKGPE